MNDRDTVRDVVRIVGLVVLGSIGATFFLALKVLEQAKGAGSPDAATIGLVGTCAAFATTGIGYLGGLLSNTRTTPTKSEIEEALAPLADAGSGGIPVTGPDGGPVLTAPAADTGPDGGSVDVDTSRRSRRS